MSADALTAAVRRFFEEVWNRGNAAAAAEFLAPGFVSHNSFGIEVLGPEGYGRSVLGFREVFPDLHTTLEDVIATDDRVIVRGTDRATHRAEFMGYPPTGRQVVTTWIEIFRIDDGKAIEGWLETDRKRFEEQLKAS